MIRIIEKITRRIRNYIGEHLLYKRFPFAYAHFYYWKQLKKELHYNNPKDFNEKLFWLARYWQDPRIVRCTDKLEARNYVTQNGLGHILTKIYAIYESADQIDFSSLPDSFVLKTNHCGGGKYMVICKEKSLLDFNVAKRVIYDGLKTIIGLQTCEYQYQFIKPTAYAEEYIGKNTSKLEIQFFCFNGQARHILVRNDLGDASDRSFAISYDMNWKRVSDRKHEDMSIDLPRPKALDEMIDIANKLAKPFPQVRVDLYLTADKVYFGEMTFSTSGNILWNYKESTIKKWGEELVLPEKMNTTWKKQFKSYIK